MYWSSSSEKSLFRFEIGKLFSRIFLVFGEFSLFGLFSLWRFYPFGVLSLVVEMILSFFVETPFAVRYLLLLDGLELLIFFMEDLVRSIFFRKVSAKLFLVNFSPVEVGMVVLVAANRSSLQFLLAKFSEGFPLTSLSFWVFFLLASFFFTHFFFWF